MSRLQPAESDAVAVTDTPAWAGTISSIDAWGVTISGQHKHELILVDYDDIEPAAEYFTEVGIHWWV